MIKDIIKNYRYIQEQTQTKDIRLKVLIIIEEDAKTKQAAARVCARGSFQKSLRAQITATQTCRGRRGVSCRGA